MINKQGEYTIRETASVMNHLRKNHVALMVESTTEQMLYILGGQKSLINKEPMNSAERLNLTNDPNKDKLTENSICDFVSSKNWT